MGLEMGGHKGEEGMGKVLVRKQSMTVKSVVLEWLVWCSGKKRRGGWAF
jgi:hypothetical protein